MARIDPRSLPRIEDARFLTGRGDFTADREPPGCLHAAMVRSDHAHAVVRDIDTAGAHDALADCRLSAAIAVRMRT